MTSRWRSTARRTAMGASALLIALGAAACTGDDDSPEEQDGTLGQQTTGEARSGPAASDGGGSEPGARVTEADLEDASARLVEGLQVLDDRDWEAACSLVLDPTTGTAPEGARLQECADDVEPAMAPLADQLEPGTFDDLEPSMVHAEATGDGTVTTSVMGEKIDVPLVRGDDGRWYFSIPF